MGRRFSTVSEMVDTLSDSKSFKERFEKESAGKSLARALFRLRNAQGLTQGDLAKKMGVAQSAISRIEHSENDKIKLDILEAYVSALGYKISVNIHPERNAVDWVKHHGLEMRKHLLQLAELGQGDSGIEEGVSGFFSEVAYNMLSFIEDSASRLKRVPKPRKTQTLEVTATAGEPDTPRKRRAKGERVPVG